MLVPDVNVYLYAVNSSAPQHAASRAWLEAAMNGQESIGFDWVVVLGFIRISTHRSILPNPLSAVEAWDIVDGWLARPVTEIVTPGPGHAGRLRALLEATGTGGNLTTDAHIASVAIGHRARVCSFDSDFDRFEGLERIQP